MCGVHCLNTLLQANAFNEVDLAQIAHELDRREREVMAEGGITSEDYLKFVAADSQNVSDEGNFSIQVLAEALKMYSVTPKPWRNGQSEPHLQSAFICNLREHWFTIRRLGGQWYNLNSLASTPEKITDFYLSAYLGQLSTEKYTIFVVEGRLPLSDEAAGSSESGHWWTEEEMERAKQAKATQSGTPDAFSSALTTTLHNMQDMFSNVGTNVTQALRHLQPGSGATGDEDADLQAAIQASLGEGQGTVTEGRNPAYGTASQRDLAQALAASLEEFKENQEQER